MFLFVLFVAACSVANARELDVPDIVAMPAENCVWTNEQNKFFSWWLLCCQGQTAKYVNFTSTFHSVNNDRYATQVGISNKFDQCDQDTYEMQDEKEWGPDNLEHSWSGMTTNTNYVQYTAMFAFRNKNSVTSAQIVASVAGTALA